MECVKEKKLQSGTLYVTVGSERYVLAECRPTIKVYEHTDILRLGGSGHEYEVKSCHASLVVCDHMNCREKVDTRYLKSVSSFDIGLGLHHADGTRYERLLESILPVTINLNGTWTFDITGHLDGIRDMFPGLIFT